jgi:hypothetical protein
VQKWTRVGVVAVSLVAAIGATVLSVPFEHEEAEASPVERPACPHGRSPGQLPGPGRDCRAARTVTLSGTAYTFSTRNTLAGATVAIAERPDLETTTAADGSWTLEVPRRADVTPWIRAEGHRDMYLQTFHTDRQDIGNINFQTPTEPVADALQALVGSFTGRDPFEDGCVVVSTVSLPDVVGMTFDEFIRFAPHGVAGARAYSDPAVPEPIYFNDAVLPDPDQELSSGDGGVMWTNVPPGVYEMHAEHPDVEFASFTATCQDNRLINANPPQGLHAVPDD